MNDRYKDLKFYFSRQTGFPFVRPDVLQLSITSACNLRCKSCNVWRQKEEERDILSINEIRSILDEAAKWGIPEVHLLGGEPFLRRDWELIASYAKQKNMSVVICSNGTLINDEIAQKIFDIKVDLLCISLDGAKKETHDFLRGEVGAYDKILQGINTVNKFDKEKRPKIVLILTVSNKNLFELTQYVDLAQTLSAHGIYLTALVLDNVNLFSQKKTHDLWIEDKYLAGLDDLFKNNYEYAKSKGYYLDYPSYKLFASYFRGESKSGDWVCFAGLKRLVVTPTADIQICGQTIGNYKKARSLKKIWASYAAFKRRMFVKNCKNYCLQDCHARPESDSFISIAKNILKHEIF